VEYRKDRGWGVPRICPVHDLVLHPATKALHYAVQLFEGLKAYHGYDGKIRLFRPELNVARLESCFGFLTDELNILVKCKIQRTAKFGTLAAVRIHTLVLQDPCQRLCLVQCSWVPRELV